MFWPTLYGAVQALCVGYSYTSEIIDTYVAHVPYDVHRAEQSSSDQSSLRSSLVKGCLCSRSQLASAYESSMYQNVVVLLCLFVLPVRVIAVFKKVILGEDHYEEENALTVA